MITFPRRAARQFRAVLRRSVLATIPRGSCPPVSAHQNAQGLTLTCQGQEVRLCFQVHGESGPDEKLTFPGTYLAQVEGANTTPVRLEQIAEGEGRLSWDDGPVPRTVDFQFPSLEEKAPGDVPNSELSLMPDEFLVALDHACRTAARQSVRYALQRIQFRGKSGQLIATDGKQLLVQGGFAFPFSEDVLVPALPVFGSRESAAATPVKLGRSQDSLVIQVGPWRFDLMIDKDGRFPDVKAVVPRGQPAARLTVTQADAEYLMDVLPGLPGEDGVQSPLTLDINGRAVARVASDGKCLELELTNSTVDGGPIRLCLERQHLYRGLRLGFREYELFAPTRPIVSREDKRLLVLMVLDPKSALAPSADAVHLTTNGRVPTFHSPGTNSERIPMATPHANGRSADTGEPIDPVAEAEALKAALQEATTRAARLVAGLRRFSKQRRTVESALASLKSVQLGSWNGEG